MHETGCSGLVHRDDPEGWDGEGGGSGIQDGEHIYTHGWFMWMYGKNHYNIVKLLASNENKYFFKKEKKKLKKRERQILYGITNMWKLKNKQVFS